MPTSDGLWKNPTQSGVQSLCQHNHPTLDAYDLHQLEITRAATVPAAFRSASRSRT